jgi:putative peptidoglycan lipid II flippase
VIMQATQIVVIRLATSATAVAAATDVDRGAGIAVYNSAFLIIMVPHSIITVSLATALLPDLSRTAAAAQTERLRSRVMDALRVALAIIIPFAGLLAAMAGPISRLLFGYGAATSDIDLVAVTLAMFLPGLVGFTTTFLVQRAFYAQEDTRTPVLVQLVVSAVQISLSVTLVPRIDPALVSAALAGCWSVATLAGAFASLWLLHRRLGRLGGLRFTGYVVAVGVAALPGTLLALGLTLRYPLAAFGSPPGALATLAAGAAVATIVYVLVAWLVRIAPVRVGVAAGAAFVRARIAARR